ncbi:MAG: glycosyltransferase family 4 protein [SAR202 cluster bacterium]|nr:glycosyltransferase family 4 protein [SAR202 cluster bacterium]
MSGPPLRVLFLTPYFRPYLGGIERAIEQLSAQLLQSSQVEAVGVLTTEYAFYIIPHPEWPDRETTAQGIAIYRLRGWPRQSPALSTVPLVWFSPWQIRRYVKEFNPSVVHLVGDGWFWGHFWAWFWYRRRARFIFTPSYHPLPPGNWWLRRFNRFLCRVVDQVVSLSRQEAEQVRKDYHLAPEKQQVIGWGASVPDIPHPSPLPQGEREVIIPSPALGEGQGEGKGEGDAPLTILCVGRLGAHKGQAWLLEVYRQARFQFNHPARLVLVGRDEDGEADLRSAIAAAGLAREVLLTGEVSDAELAGWYQQADLFSLFSQYEAFGLAYFEGMSCGVPVLTHDVGANRELLARGAVIVPRYDMPAAVGQMVRLVNDHGLRQRLGEEARQYALAGFSWASVAERYLRVYTG